MNKLIEKVKSLFSEGNIQLAIGFEKVTRGHVHSFAEV